MTDKNKKRVLSFGDLIVGPDGMPAIVLAAVDPDDHGEVPVAMARGTEEMVPAVGLLPVPSAHGSPATANFAEWIVPCAPPGDRAVYAFIGHGLGADPDEFNRAAVALLGHLAPLVAGLSDECFGDTTKREFLRKTLRVLSPH